MQTAGRDATRMRRDGAGTLIGRVSYRIDAGDRIVEVGDDWAAFARANDAPHLADEVEGRPLWNFVSGDLTRQVYRELLVHVRSGRPASFDYRCDAPQLQRFMRMTMRAVGHDGVQFESVTVRTEARTPAIAMLPPATAERLVRMCSWCKRVADATSWLDLDAAVDAFGLLTRTTAVAISHSMCPACYARFLNEVDAPQGRKQ
jgi:hypothetical protein